MILKALADYYKRLADDPNVEIAPRGFERRSIDFLIEVTRNGRFVNLRDLRTRTGKKKKGRASLVPKAVKRTAGIASNLLWDTPEYVLGCAVAGKPSKKLGAKRRAFLRRIEETFASLDDEGVNAVLTFLGKGDFAIVLSHPVWAEVEQDGGNISFILSGETRLVCQRPRVNDAIREAARSKGTLQTCVVTGMKDVPAELHAAIKNVWGAQSSGANIVSFNLDAFRSFGKKKGFNAPVGQSAEFAYTTALNYLLTSGNQRMQIGDASTVFWAKDPCDLESDFLDFLSPERGETIVSYGKIRALLSAVRTGIPPEEANMPFYVLGLAPNAARIAIRFWHEGNVKELKERIAQHFEDIRIVRSSRDPEFLSLFQTLVATAAERKADNIPPNLGGEVARAVLRGTSYPRTLFGNAIRRNKAEQNVTYARASIIKGFLVRSARLARLNKKEVSMKLDRTYDNIGYVLGRLFAVFERIQEQASGSGLNKTIRDTYFGAATSSPLVTFNRLNQLAIHHLAKMRNSGKNSVWLEKLLGEVNGLLPKEGIPAILDLEDQGRFAIGYYHQRQDFFTKSKPADETENEKE